MGEEYRGGIVSLPCDLNLPNTIRMVRVSDEQEYKLRKVWAEIEDRAYQSARDEWFRNMEELRPYWNMPLD